MKKVVFVLRDSGKSGGCRTIHVVADGLVDRGYQVELCYLTGDSENWYKNAKFSRKSFANSYELIRYIKSDDYIRVATWWETASWVAEAGGGYYLVQDIESSYYGHVPTRHKVLETYSLGLTHLTINAFQYAVLKLVYNATVYRIGIGIDHDIFKVYKIPKDGFMLYCYRKGQIKNPDFMAETLECLGQGLQGFKFYSYGHNVCPFAHENFVYLEDDKVAELYNRAGLFISTSRHEGFNLPLVEAMACGTPVISTRAVGNETFCIDGLNCLLADSPKEMAEAIIRLFKEDGLYTRILANGLETAKLYTWDKVIDRVENIFFKGVKYGN